MLNSYKLHHNQLKCLRKFKCSLTQRLHNLKQEQEKSNGKFIQFYTNKYQKKCTSSLEKVELKIKHMKKSPYYIKDYDMFV